MGKYKLFDSSQRKTLWRTVGAETPVAEQGKQPYKYNGKELDQMNGLNQYDYSARYYDPAIARFTTMDPMAEKYYSVSPYAYCNNNPVNAVDPTGLAWRPTYDENNNGNINQNGYETATVYLADGTTTTYDAMTNPSDPDAFATVPEGIYHATVGKAGKNNFTGTFNNGQNGVSQGCLLISTNSWSSFIGNFNNSTQKSNTLSVTVSRSMTTPINANRLPAFNFFMNGTRRSFLNPY